jgi:hypothetical protein
MHASLRIGGCLCTREGRKRLTCYSDEYCPHCDNHFVLDALTPKASLNVEGEDARVDNRMIKDERQRQKDQRTIFDVEDAANRLG